MRCWLSCRSACASRRRSAGCLRSRSTRTCRALPVDDLQAGCGRVQHALAPSSAAWWTRRLQRRCTARVRRHRVCPGRLRSPALGPPRCGAGCRAVRRAVSRLRSARRPRSSSTCTCFVVDASLAASLYRVRRSRSTRRAYAANTVVGVRPPGASNSGFAALLYASLLS